MFFFVQFLKLAGKRQRGKEKIDIIDVHAHEQTSVEQLTKNLTEEVSGFSHSRKKDDLPSSQSRRKHQITYLAYQVCSPSYSLGKAVLRRLLNPLQKLSVYILNLSVVMFELFFFCALLLLHRLINSGKSTLLARV